MRALAAPYARMQPAHAGLVLHMRASVHGRLCALYREQALTGFAVGAVRQVPADRLPGPQLLLGAEEEVGEGAPRVLAICMCTPANPLLLPSCTGYPCMQAAVTVILRLASAGHLSTR